MYVCARETVCNINTLDVENLQDKRVREHRQAKADFSVLTCRMNGGKWAN